MSVRCKPSSNGARTDGTSMNVGLELNDRPSIRLFTQYSSGDAMKALLTDEGMGYAPGSPNKPSAASRQQQPRHHQHSHSAPAPLKKGQVDDCWGETTLGDVFKPAN
eukprot:TRINITY_DN731_c0_g1_i5.p2 TRINITY_DN731_c0_g1~~TRINITY_DN731_c0_g1_i5.p2  ORF type:complete len:107 (+),score=23.46 TRINITY_DN731_c0_g1_i5:89-409(+)